MNKRIAIIWSHWTWKSTLLSELKKRLNKFEFIDEVARSEIKRVWKNPQDMTTDEYEFFQRKILAEQIKSESKKTINNINFISDRSVLDVLAYSEQISEEVYDILYKRVKEYLEHLPYTDVYYIPIQFELEQDWVRYIWDEFQEIIDDRIKRLLSEFKINYIELTGTVKERADTITRNL